MKPRLLVVTTVHPADDPRIREKLIRTMAPDFDVSLAAATPPSDPSGVTWVPLRGGRVRRNIDALRACLFSDAEVVSLHDPELLPCGLLTRMVRGKAVVFDVHENIPQQILTKEWIPGFVRPLISLGARLTLRVAELFLNVTLAESGYAGLFRRPHPVFPNYLDVAGLPDPVASDDGPIVYLGDVSAPRGALTAVRAVGSVGAAPPLVMIGRCREELASSLQAAATRAGVSLELAGWLPHSEALERVRHARLALVPLHDIPNYRFSLPTKLLEYLALGVPVLASDLPGVREVTTGLGGVRLVAPEDEAAWSLAIEAALGDEAFRDAARTGYASVRERFAWPGTAVAAYYRSLARIPVR